MTEKQWLRSADAEAMNEFFGHRHTERKARLLMLACCQRHPEFLAHEAIRTMTDMLIEHYADPQKPDTPFNGRKISAAYRQFEATPPRRLIDRDQQVVPICTRAVPHSFDNVIRRAGTTQQSKTP